MPINQVRSSSDLNEGGKVIFLQERNKLSELITSLLDEGVQSKDLMQAVKSSIQSSLQDLIHKESLGKEKVDLVVDIHAPSDEERLRNFTEDLYEKIVPKILELEGRLIKKNEVVQLVGKSRQLINDTLGEIRENLPEESGVVGVHWVKKISGVGSVDVVYEADISGEKRAIKIRKKSPLVNNQLTTKKLVEATSGGNYPQNIMQTYSSLGEGVGAIDCFEYLEGKTLKTLITKESARQNPKLFIALFLEMIKGVHNLSEAGIVHADVKPANFMLAKGNDGEWNVKLIDFGYAVHAGFVNGNNIACTPNYAPKEQFIADDTLTEKTDVYALATILYTFLGERPEAKEVSDHIDFFFKEGGEHTADSVYENLPKDWNEESKKNFITLLSVSLRNNPDKRPTTDQLLRITQRLLKKYDSLDELKKEAIDFFKPRVAGGSDLHEDSENLAENIKLEGDDTVVMEASEMEGNIAHFSDSDEQIDELTEVNIIDDEDEYEEVSDENILESKVDLGRPVSYEQNTFNLYKDHLVALLDELKVSKDSAEQKWYKLYQERLNYLIDKSTNPKVDTSISSEMLKMIQELEKREYHKVFYDQPKGGLNYKVNTFNFYSDHLNALLKDLKSSKDPKKLHQAFYYQAKIDELLQVNESFAVKYEVALPKMMALIKEIEKKNREFSFESYKVAYMELSVTLSSLESQLHFLDRDRSEIIFDVTEEVRSKMNEYQGIFDQELLLDEKTLNKKNEEVKRASNKLLKFKKYYEKITQEKLKKEFNAKKIEEKLMDFKKSLDFFKKAYAANGYKYNQMLFKSLENKVDFYLDLLYKTPTDQNKIKILNFIKSFRDQAD